LLAIYPNPAKESIRIQLIEKVSGPVDVSISMMNGAELFRRSLIFFCGTSPAILISHLEPGVYVLTVQSIENTYKGKVLIIK
jgi:hypothetical protein